HAISSVVGEGPTSSAPIIETAERWSVPLSIVSAACRVCRPHTDDVEQHHDEQERGELCIWKHRWKYQLQCQASIRHQLLG
ncbi:hypothetical protein GW17_00004665, partial [Ensete ventricosum]